ncbi:MAG: hypothetical protein K2W99_04335 [Chthoniobacterales bacterium]|nr:hypothetical protein [Chthoniobacterales bacterium]
MNAKTTLELPAPLLHQIKAAALQCHITMKQFFCDAVKEKLARTAVTDVVQPRIVIPPPPKIPRKELDAINRKILTAAAEVHPGDWE